MTWNLIGNDWAGDLLQRQMRNGTLRHAYLITGPQGVGRTRLALALAQAILCEAPPAAGEWCGACRACRQVPQRTYPDLHWVERAEDKQGITIDQVRELQRLLSLSAAGRAGRVAVLQDVEQASEGAANALLKTLEEPAPRVHLLLTASDAEEVAPTIASRCEVLALRPVSAEEIGAALELSGQEPAEARRLAEMASGRPGLALQMLADPTLRRRRQSYADELQETLGMDLADRFARADAWKDDEALEERLAAWLTLLGEALRATVAGRGRAPDNGFPQFRDPDKARSAVDAVLRTQEALRRNGNPRLALEVLMLELPVSAGKAAERARRTSPG
ncbi:MAG TPA: DNA polymerase III subunit delta' [Anaerolineales bacterium]|nr:DNA polymerase III subunit delta' [Anaerolineales bacterium]